METIIIFLLLLNLSSAAQPSLPPTPAPARSPAAPAGPSTLDPKQREALLSLGIPVSHSSDPCSNPSPHNNATFCDNASPFKHVISLHLSNCSTDLDLSSTALRSLSTLRSLSFSDCPVQPPHHLPSSLVSNLRAFSCSSSLHRLTGVWISRLQNLTSLTVADVPISASAPYVILSRMPHLVSLSITNANLSGSLPRHWHSLNFTTINLSDNRLTGNVPTSISLLSSLQSLNLSSNSFSGVLPESIGDLDTLKNVSFSNNTLSGPLPETMSGMAALTHIDLSSNQFNGSIPKFFASMKRLKYLNLENNNFQGVFPFNASFIKKLEFFKVGGNSNLCYNHSVLSSKLKLGIARCDKYGMPVSPPPDKSSADDSSDYSDDGSGDNGAGNGSGGGGGHHGPNKLLLGIAITLACLVFMVVCCICMCKRCR